MGPSPVRGRQGKERRVENFISLAQSLLDSLPNAGGTLSNTLLTEVESAVQSFPDRLTHVAAPRYKEIDEVATTLWNLCTRLRREHSDNSGRTSVLLHARTYAFLLLDLAQKCGHGDGSGARRVMKVGLKAIKNCFDLKQYDIANKITEKIAVYEAELSKESNSQASEEDVMETTQLSSEYFILRTALEWQRGHIEVAEFMYKKANPAQRKFAPNAAENFADVLYEIGKDQIQKKEPDLAIKWLERAHDVLVDQDLDKLSSMASELRISIIQSSVKALLLAERQDAHKKAEQLVAVLRDEIGDKLVVLLLQLELLESATAEDFDHDAYATVLRLIVRTVVLSENVFNIIMYRNRQLYEKSPSLACRILDELLRGRMLGEAKESWIEKAVINRIWMATGQKDGMEVTIDVKGVLNMIQGAGHELSASATHAAQTLLWKRIDSSHGLAQHELAICWCQLAMHPVFKNAGDLNKAKIARKLLLCLLAAHNFQDTQAIWDVMSDTAKDDPLTRFLIFKIAMRNEDVALAQECLEKVYSSATTDPNLLYACVKDAEQVGNKQVAASALQLVLRKHEYDTLPSIHLPALLRCAIRLTMSQLDVAGKSTAPLDTGDIVEQLCKLFEGAASQAQRERNTSDRNEVQFGVSELEWFSRVSYNLAIENCIDWELRYVLQLLRSCIQFMDLYPSDVGEHLADDLAIRKIFCDYLSSMLLIAFARGEDSVEDQLQHYLTARKHINNFDTLILERSPKLDPAAVEDLHGKLSILLTYDLEAAVHLKAWNEIPGIILRSSVCANTKMYQLMADILLSCQAPADVVVPNLKRIVNETWNLKGLDVDRLSVYMRCLFRYALPQDPTVAEDILNQVKMIAEDAASKGVQYPPEELEWLATTAFNHAIDFYCAGEDEKSRSWAEHAINLAHVCADDGALQRLLQEKFLGLQWDT